MRPPTLYYWIRFASSPDRSESDQYGLVELGALGAEEEEGPEIRVKGSFADRRIWSEALQALRQKPGLESGESPWEDWDRSWRDRQTPVHVTPHLVVCPPWVGPPPAAHVIRLEAKMAFGTGSHESTRIAALLLEASDLQRKSLLDVGTGTGILALYAAQRGAAFAAGFDIDPVTGACLAENLGLNPPPGDSICAFFVGTLEAMGATTRFDFVLCNMIRTEVWPLLDPLLGLLRPGGVLLVSGQRVEDQRHWREWFQDRGLAPAREIRLEDWWGFALCPSTPPKARV